MFGESSEVGLVGDRDRGVAAKASSEHRSEGHIAPAEVGGQVDESVSTPRETDDGDADSCEVVAGGHGRDQRFGQLDGVLDGLVRRESTTLTIDADVVEDMGAEAHGRHGDRVDRQLDGEDDGALGAGSDER